MGMSGIKIVIAVLMAGALSAQPPAAAPKEIVLPPGDIARGKAIFEGKGQCLTCHRVNGNGSRQGPDLSEIGAARKSAEYLEAALIDPDADVAAANRYVRVVTKDGVAITGKLLNHDNFTIQMLDPQDKLRSFSRSDLKQSEILVKSQMPSYKGKLSQQEIADVINYLSSLKGLQ
jgi:putative heme-binding domain-containing protein